MESSPEYVCMWLGLAKIGVVPALINFNLRMNSMAHCIAAAEAKAVVFTDTLAQGNSCIREFYCDYWRKVPLVGLRGEVRGREERAGFT